MNSKTECLDVERWENEGGPPLTQEAEMKRVWDFEFQMKRKQEVHHEYAHTRAGKSNERS